MRDLLNDLIKGTEAGTVRWKPAPNFDGYIARTPGAHLTLDRLREGLALHVVEHDERAVTIIDGELNPGLAPRLAALMGAVEARQS